MTRERPLPIYSYTCESCSHHFELRQGYDAASEQECPQCQGTGKRQFHAVGVIYKGSGFYTTDYQRPRPSSPKTAEGSSKSSSKSSSDSSESSDASTPSSSDSD